MIEVGDTFILSEVTGTSHLWIVLSHPDDDQRVLVANVATMRPYHDQTCVLHNGDHPFVQHDSCVCYDRAKMLDMTYVEKWGKEQEPLSDPVLDRVLQGAADSDRIELGYVQLLREQGLVA